MVAVVTSLRHRPKVVTFTPSFDVDTGVVAVAMRGAVDPAVATRGRGRLDLVEGTPARIAMVCVKLGRSLELSTPALQEEDDVSRNRFRAGRCGR